MLVAIHTDDQRRSHELRTDGGAQSDGALREDDHRVPDLDPTALRTPEAGRGDVREQHDLLIGHLVGNFREVRLRVRHQQILRLRAVDRVAKTPASHRPAAEAVAALRVLAREAGAALPAGRDGPDQHAVADVVAGDARAEFLDDAHRFMADDEPRLHRILAAHDMEIGAADRGGSDAQDRLAGTRGGLGHGIDADVIHAVKDVGEHGGHGGWIGE